MDTIYGRFEWDEAKRQANLTKHGLDFESAELVYDHPQKVTVGSVRSGEQRYVDTAVIFIAGVYLSLVYITRNERIRIISFEWLRVAKEEGLISPDSKSDWEHVFRMQESGAPIPYDPEDGPYDPNDDAAVDAYWDAATITHGPGAVARR